MEYFFVIKDSDIFENFLSEPKEYTLRPTVKGFVFDDENKIALIWHPTEKYGLLPGGGVEEGEAFEEGFIRECKEEIGCDIEIVSSLGTAVQFRAKDSRRYETHFYIAKVVGEKGVPTTTQEDELGIETRWMTIEELEAQLEEQAAFKSEDWYQRQFNSRTHFAALKKYLQEK